MRWVSLLLVVPAMMVGVVCGYGQYSAAATQYTISFPLGNTKDRVDQVSFRGFTFDYRYHINDSWCIGARTGWYTFYEEKDRATYTLSEGHASLTGKQFRYINSLPLLFMGDYYFHAEQNMSAFAGFGAGVTYNRLDVRMSQEGARTDAWQFSLSPEIGVRMKLDADLYGYVALSYNNCFSTDDLEAQSYLNLSIGLLYH
ncbi:outer membrane beta-barrel protein [Fulvivirgaceae bacterium PWU4]|uniref:Outer membrane beta-barrel protein n=1 Tax=Chryseosolibacter histidini TaxID=2782349 RepID=A0AAP2DQ70_9BACT|nr:outer membrane beta-barrel protein [Chryseosolibacter histidini]MBT1699544.1 outer membrane beta-barrel protein [Chryseosolibacter histidini]